MKRTTETVKEIESPSGLDLHPQPPSPVRLSKRAGILVLVVVFAVAALVGYGIVTRGNRSFQTGFHPDDAKGLTAATDAGKVIAAQIPNRAGIVGGSADRQPAQAEELRPPGQALVAPAAIRALSGCTHQPRTRPRRTRRNIANRHRKKSDWPWLMNAKCRRWTPRPLPKLLPALASAALQVRLPRALKGAAPSLLDCSGRYKGRRQQRPDLAWRGTESFPA